MERYVCVHLVDAWLIRIAHVLDPEALLALDQDLNTVLLLVRLLTQACVTMTNDIQLEDRARKMRTSIATKI